MGRFFKSCRRCLNPWIVGLIIVVVVGLLIFVPIISGAFGLTSVGVASLIAVLPLVGCTVMCGAMAFMMRGKGQDKK